MNISDAILSKDENEANTAKEFASFLLRYHETLDYGDFTADAFAIQKLRRYENTKYAAEIEMLNTVTRDQQ
jgi:hypothetical protein